MSGSGDEHNPFPYEGLNAIEVDDARRQYGDNVFGTPESQVLRSLSKILQDPTFLFLILAVILFLVLQI